jgi:ATP-binding cassette subfamily B protein
MRSIWRDDIPRITNPLRFFLFVSKPHMRAAVVGIACVVVATTLNAFIPYLYKVIADTAVSLSSGSYEKLWWAVGAYLAVNLTSTLIWRGSGFAGMHWATGVRATSRSALSAYLTNHSNEYFANRFAGSLLSKVKQAADGMRDMSETFLWQFLRFIVSLVASFIIVFVTSPIVGLILVALFLVITPLNIFFARRRVPYSVAAQDAETALNGATVDVVGNISSVQEYAKRRFEIDRLKSFIMRRKELGLRNWRYGEWVLLGNGIIQNIFMGAMMVMSVYLASKGIITPGDIVLFLAMIFLLEEQLTFIGSEINTFAETWGQVKESLADILVPFAVTDRLGAPPLSVKKGAVELANVSFGYEEKVIFEGLSLSIPAGQKVGLIGRSGAGKSTLFKLLLRHYDVTGGRVLIDGQDVAAVTRESLNAAIAVVPQEPALFHRTIHENIAYARAGASRADVMKAAASAQAHEFIEELPEGYESLVGERGVKLSGGQRQRVVIARALLKDAPILLLDEATSALDSESEVLVQKALLALMKGRTVIAIAHRLSTLRAMDRLIVFDEGTIVEDGTHEELLRKQGVYADLWHHQAGGFLEE